MTKKSVTILQNHISPRLSSLKSPDFGDLPCASTTSLLRQERKGDPRNLTISRMTPTGGSNCGQWLEKLNLKRFLLASLIVCSKSVWASEATFILDPRENDGTQVLTPETVGTQERVEVIKTFSNDVIRFFQEEDQASILSGAYDTIAQMQNVENDQKIFLIVDERLDLATRIFLLVGLLVDAKIDEKSTSSWKGIVQWLDQDFLEKSRNILEQMALDQNTPLMTKLKAVQGCQICGLDAKTPELSKTLVLDPLADIDTRKKALGIFFGCFLAKNESDQASILLAKELAIVILESSVEPNKKSILLDGVLGIVQESLFKGLPKMILVADLDTESKLLALDKMVEIARKYKGKDQIVLLFVGDLAELLSSIILDPNSSTPHKIKAMNYLVGYCDPELSDPIIKTLTRSALSLHLDEKIRLESAIVLRSIDDRSFDKQPALNCIEMIMLQTTDPQIKFRAYQNSGHIFYKSDKALHEIKKMVLDQSIDMNLRLEATEILKYYIDEKSIFEISRSLQKSPLDSMADKVKTILKALVFRLRETSEIKDKLCALIDADIWVDLYGNLQLIKAKKETEIFSVDNDSFLITCLRMTLSKCFGIPDHVLKRETIFKDIALDESRSLSVRLEAVAQLNQYGLNNFTDEENNALKSLSPSFTTNLWDYVDATWNKNKITTNGNKKED